MNTDHPPVPERPAIKVPWKRGKASSRKTRWIVLLLLPVALGGCGTSAKSRDSVATVVAAATETPKPVPKCMILENGTKLCDADARTYCEGFVEDGDEDQTVEACQAVGIDIKTKAEVQKAQEEAATEEFESRSDAAIWVEVAGENAAGTKFLFAERSGRRITATFAYEHQPPARVIESVCRDARKDYPGTTLRFETDDLDQWWDCAGEAHLLY